MGVIERYRAAAAKLREMEKTATKSEQARSGFRYFQQRELKQEKSTCKRCATLTEALEKELGENNGS